MKIGFILAVLVVTGLQTLEAQKPKKSTSLKGSKASVALQAKERAAHHYDRLPNKPKLKQFEAKGILVPIKSNKYVKVKASNKYARPEVKLFIDRFSKQYKANCGEKMVVTSLTRTLDKQPRNASKLSVHPAGMALDVRVSKKAACRLFLENTTLTLERLHVLEATRERHPPHYHIAVFPEYKQYVSRR